MLRAGRFVSIISLLTVLSAAYRCLGGVPVQFGASPPEFRPSALDALDSSSGVYDVRYDAWVAPSAKAIEWVAILNVYWSRNHEFLISDEWTRTPAGWWPSIVITTWDPVARNFRKTYNYPNESVITAMCHTDNGEIEWTTDHGHTVWKITAIKKLSAEDSAFETETISDDGKRWTSAKDTIRRSHDNSK